MRERPKWWPTLTEEEAKLFFSSMPNQDSTEMQFAISMFRYGNGWGEREMAKVLLERIEALASTATMCDGSEAEIALSKEDWTQLKREVLGE